MGPAGDVSKATEHRHVVLKSSGSGEKGVSRRKLSSSIVPYRAGGENLREILCIWHPEGQADSSLSRFRVEEQQTQDCEEVKKQRLLFPGSLAGA